MIGVVIAGAGVLVTGQIDPANTSVGYSLPAAMPILVPVAVILLPLIDFVWAVVRRMAKGQSPFHADAGHLHHRLLRRGHSHAGAVLILYMWAAVASLSCVALVIFPPLAVTPLAVVSIAGAVVITRREMSAPARARAQKNAVASVVADDSSPDATSSRPDATSAEAQASAPHPNGA